MIPSTKIVEVAAGVVIRDGFYLITQRRPDADQGGLWEFPGGKRQPGESLPDCLRREFKEELGVTVQVGEALKVIRHTYQNYTLELYFYLCTILDGTPRTLDNQAYRWVPRSDLAQYVFPEANRALIQELQAYP